MGWQVSIINCNAKVKKSKLRKISLAFTKKCGVTSLNYELQCKSAKKVICRSVSWATLTLKKLKKKNYVSSKYGKISEKSSSEDSDDGGSNDKVNEGASTSKVNEGASSSINTFDEKDGLVCINSDFNVTCKEIGFKKQTKFDVENNNYQIKFEPKQGKSQILIIVLYRE